MVDARVRLAPLGFSVICCSWLSSACGSGANGGETILQEGTPVVLETVPADGERDVDAGLNEIRATFSEAMRPEGWSWVTEAHRSAPVVVGLPHYVDALTAVLPVRLEPNTTYVVWVNSPDDSHLRKFESTRGLAAPAYRIRFSTGASNNAASSDGS